MDRTPTPAGYAEVMVPYQLIRGTVSNTPWPLQLLDGTSDKQRATSGLGERFAPLASYSLKGLCREMQIIKWSCRVAALTKWVPLSRFSRTWVVMVLLAIPDNHRMLNRMRISSTMLDGLPVERKAAQQGLALKKKTKQNTSIRGSSYYVELTSLKAQQQRVSCDCGLLRTSLVNAAITAPAIPPLLPTVPGKGVASPQQPCSLSPTSSQSEWLIQGYQC